jgi:hypothetical protein
MRPRVGTHEMQPVVERLTYEAVAAMLESVLSGAS